jgi:hypothetical protein
MSEAKHTPGPWMAEDQPGSGICIKAKVDLGKDNYDGGLQTIYHVPIKPCLFICDDGGVMAQLSYEGWRQFPSKNFQEMQRANALLIASAPDLLDTVHDLRQQLASAEKLADELQTKCEALEKDKTRLDWLESDKDDEITFRLRCCDAGEFRLSIDEQMEEERKK